MNGTKTVTFEDIERRLLEMHTKAYYAWIRQVVTLSAGSLTALVALKNNYVSANPQALLLLKACWAGLALSILLGVVALFGEAQTPLDAVNNIRKDRKELGDEATARKLTKNSGTMPKKRYIYAQKTLYYSFAASVLLLCAFAIVNM